jgi:hypothetical protein
MAHIHLPPHNKSDDIVCDPWHKHAEKDALLPDDVRFACAYELFVAFEWFDEAAFFCRTETTDELWTGAGGCSADGPRGRAASYAETPGRARLSHVGARTPCPRETGNLPPA